MNLQSKRLSVDCIDSRRIVKHFVWRSAGLAVAALIGFCQPAAAQTTILTNGGVATGAISCAPSNNGTGHMVCLEYSTAGSLIGLSWQAPPAAGGNTELVGKVDVVTPPLVSPSGTLVGAPGCGPENNGAAGTIACLVVSKTASGSFILQGIAFYPPGDDAGTAAPSGLLTLATEPANTVIGNPSCTATNSAGAVVCAITINGQLFGTGFEPKSNIFSAPGTTTTPALTPLLSGGVTGNPSCIAGGAANPADCAIRQGNALVGFALSYTPPPSGSTVARIAAEDAITVGSMSFTGDPSCGIPPNGQVGTTSLVATCGIVSGTTLFGVSFDPIDAIPALSPASHTTAFQSLGKAQDTGSWTGGIGCSSFADFRGGDVSPNQNLIGCVAISSTHNVFEVTFDPRAPVSRGVVGPFGANANANLSCLQLNIDRDNIYCGGTTTTGASGGYLIPAGVLSPATAAVLARFLSN